jgi:hypothetical protein
LLVIILFHVTGGTRLTARSAMTRRSDAK